MKLFMLLFLACTLCSVKSDTVQLNTLMDSILTSVNEIATKGGKQTVPLAYLQIPFHKNWGWLSVTGTLTCQNGEVGELNTLKRTGDVTLTTNGNTVTLKASLGLGILDFHFPICRAKARFISVHGHVSGNVTSDSLSIQVSLTYNGQQCSAKLDSISLDSIGILQVNLGGGNFHEFEDLLIEYLVKRFNSDLKDHINSQLTSIVGPAILKDSSKLCQQIPH